MTKAYQQRQEQQQQLWKGSSGQLQRAQCMQGAARRSKLLQWNARLIATNEQCRSFATESIRVVGGKEEGKKSCVDVLKWAKRKSTKQTGGQMTKAEQALLPWWQLMELLSHRGACWHEPRATFSRFGYLVSGPGLGLGTVAP